MFSHTWKFGGGVDEIDQSEDNATNSRITVAHEPSIKLYFYICVFLYPAASAFQSLARETGLGPEKRKDAKQG